MSHRPKWSIRNYNTFLREVKRQHGITHREAQRVYRSTRERLGRSLFGVDAKRHPRILKQEVRSVTRVVRPSIPSREIVELPEAPTVQYVRSLEDWTDNYDLWEDEYGLDVEEWESTADYEES